MAETLENQEVPENQESPENRKATENQEDLQKEPKTEGKKSSSGFLFGIILTVVIATSAGAGLGVGRIFAKSKVKPLPVDEITPLEQKQQLEIDKLLTENTVEGPKSWYYNPQESLVVIANLNEPGVNRYVRMSLIVEVSSAVDQIKGTAFLDEKKPLLVNYLTVYLSSLSVEDVRGDKNLKRIQSQIKDLLNEKLFPDAKPQITSVLFKEFSIQ
ncbi:MAG: flagellar basal body-associated FliL family protein [Planctomycetota bacterium]|jgi:flagellar basal body-associated protein FliL